MKLGSVYEFYNSRLIIIPYNIVIEEDGETELHFISKEFNGWEITDIPYLYDHEDQMNSDWNIMTSKMNYKSIFYGIFR